MPNQNMNQSQMLRWIDEVSFAVTDVLLYLDTHPDDVDAINYFNHYNMEREKALKIYASQFTPLVLANVDDCNNHWNWVTDPWPWEGGCR